MSAGEQANVLGGRALKEALRTPESLVPTLFIPMFFLVVNLGQAGQIFPSSSTSFLHGQSYAAFQLPASLLLAASFGSAALYLVEDIEGGYFGPSCRIRGRVGLISCCVLVGSVVDLVVFSVGRCWTGRRVSAGGRGSPQAIERSEAGPLPAGEVRD